MNLEIQYDPNPEVPELNGIKVGELASIEINGNLTVGTVQRIFWVSKTYPGIAPYWRINLKGGTSGSSESFTPLPKAVGAEYVSALLYHPQHYEVEALGENQFNIRLLDSEALSLNDINYFIGSVVDRFSYNNLPAERIGEGRAQMVRVQFPTL